MKKFLRFGFLTALLAISGWGYAQSTIDYEIVGNDWTWSAFENGTNTDGSFTVVANPDATGINTSATCGMMTVNADGALWAGAESKHGEDVVPFIFDADNTTITIMVYKSVVSPVGLKFAESNGEAQPELKVSNTKINEWEELTFDLSGSIGAGITGIIDQVIIFPDFPAVRTAGSVCYVDNIKFGTGAPSLNFSKVGFTIEAAGGDKTLNIGTAISWTAASDQTWLTLSAASGSGDAAITMTATENTLSDPRTAIVTITGGDATSQEITVTQDGKPLVLTSAPTPPVRDAGDVISIFSEAYTAVTTTYQNWSATNMTEESIGTSDDKVKKVNSTCCFGYEFSSPADMSTFTKLHLDIYPTTVTSITIGIVANGEHKKAITLTPDTWNSIDILLSDLTTVDNLASVVQTGFWDINGEFYMDNVYFFKEGGVVDNDATLSDLLVDDTSIEGFNPNVISYTVELDEGTIDVPTVTATTTDNAANAVITPASAIPGTTTVLVTAADGVTTITYSVEFIEIAAPIALPLDFEAGPYTFNDFDGGAVTVIDNPQSGGINTSAKVAQMVKNSGAEWGGSWIGLDSPIDFSASTTFRMKVYSPRVGAKVLLKLENLTNSAIFHEVEVLTTVANAWEELNFDFSAINTADAYQKIILIFDNGTMGDGTANYTFLFDDILGGGTTSISEVQKLEVNIYSFEKQLFINCEDALIDGNIEVYDLLGRNIITRKITNTNTELSLNEKGIYVVRISDKTNQIQMSKKVFTW